MNVVFRIFLSTLLLFFFHTNKLHCQSRQHVWIDHYSYIPLSEKLTFDTELGLRLLVNDAIWQRYNLRNILTYQLNDVFAMAGGINFHTWDDDFAANSHEIRSWQALKVSLPLLGAKINNQFRYEERFMRNFHHDNFYCGRLRYEISANIPIRIHSTRNQELFMPISEEVFYNLGTHAEVFPRINRLGGGIGYKLNQNFKAEVLYFKQYTKRDLESHFHASDNLYRLKFRYYWTKN